MAVGPPFVGTNPCEGHVGRGIHRRGLNTGGLGGGLPENMGYCGLNNYTDWGEWCGARPVAGY